MTAPGQPGTELDTTLHLSPETVQRFAQMAMLIPSETTDAVESIVSAILNSPTWEMLSDPWESRSAEELDGKRLRIDGLQRRPSDYRDGLGIFLVVHCTDLANGEKFAWPTGSVSVVAQLVRAYAGGWLPLIAEIIIAERTTENGYRPHHLKFLGRVTANEPKEEVPF